MAAATTAWGILEQHATRMLTVQPGSVKTGGNLRDRLDSALHPDLALVSRCIGGDESAWEELIRLHSRRVYGLCFRFTNSVAQAQDLDRKSVV